MKNQQKEKRYKISIGWKRSLIVTVVVALLAGMYSFADLGSKVQAADYAKIVGIESYDHKGISSGPSTNSYFVAKLDDGSQFNLPDSAYTAITLSKDDKKIRRVGFNESSYYYMSRLTKTGDLYLITKEGVETKVLTDVKDFELFPSQDDVKYASFFALMNDGSVQAWGRGRNGELGIGYQQDKSVPTEVVDPATGDPIENVRKIFQLGRDHQSSQGVLLVKDTEVYLIGKAFTKNSFTAAKPIKLDIFPTFSGADFDMKYLENVPVAITYIEKNYSIDQLGSTERLVFTINQKEYVMSDLYKAEDQPANNAPATDLLKTTLIPMPDGVSTSEIQRVTAYQATSNSFGTKKTISTGIVRLHEGELSYWGTPFADFGTLNPGFNGTPRVMATGVKSVSTASNGDFFYLRNNNVYGFGMNPGGRLGVLGGTQETPVRITGTNNEVKNVKELAVGNNGTYALKEDGTLVWWSNSTDFRTLDRKFLGLLTVKRDFRYNTTVYAIGEDMNLYHFNGYTYNQIGKGVLPPLAPADYVAPITKPDTPVLSISSQDKFNQSYVSINFGTTGDIATKQYQINGGGWLDYTGEVLITQSGKVTIQARSADSKGNISEVGELKITSNPIVITAGHPNLEKVSADEFKITAEATGIVKVQVKVDGSAWQDFNVANNLLLTPGNHKVEVRLLNDRDQELISKSFDVTADDPTPVAVPKPVISQKGLNNQFGLDIEVSFNSQDGEASYSIDGGAWTPTTGSFSVSNAAHTIRAKLVAVNGKESEVTEFITTVSQPKVTVISDQVSIDLGIVTNDVTVYYKDSNNNQWVEYTGPITYVPGTHNIEIEVRDRNTGTPVFTGGPYTVTVIDPNPGNPGDGGTTPDPGTGMPVGEEDVDFTVNGGGLSAKFEGADLSTIIIDNTNPYQTINSVSRVLIDDSRGNGEGYQYSMNVTDFVSEPMQDNSTNTQSLVVSIPANALSVDVLNTKTINGPAAELSNVGKHIFTGNGPEMLATAKAFEGMGYNEIPLNFKLSVPDRVKIVTSGAGSKFIAGEFTGLMAGIYKAQITTTLVSGI